MASPWLVSTRRRGNGSCEHPDAKFMKEQTQAVRQERVAQGKSFFITRSLFLLPHPKEVMAENVERDFASREQESLLWGNTTKELQA